MANKIYFRFYGLILLLLGLSAFHSTAFATSVDDILQQDQPPVGVVFEVASSQPDKLRKIVPMIQQHVKQLRQRFPDLDIAVVTHGKEQFSLTQNNEKNYSEVHQQVKSLVKDTNVAVHVCETYAGWKNIDASEFPDYVDVAPAGPAQINNYKALGYVLIKIK